MKNKIILGLSLILVGLLFISAVSKPEWKLYKHQKGVSFYFQTVDCDDVKNGLFQNFVILKLVNNTDFDLKIRFKKELYYNDKCANCDSDSEEHYVNITLKAKEEISGDCKSADLSIFKEFKDKDDVAKLSKFELSDITVKQKLN